MNFFHELPEKLQASAYSAGGEYAWAKQDAIDVIEHLQNIDLAICGIEIWLPTDLGPTIPAPFIYGWAVKHDKNEPWEEWKVRSKNEAIEYLGQFSWDRNDLEHQDLIPFFNLTFCIKSDMYI